MSDPIKLAREIAERDELQAKTLSGVTRQVRLHRKTIQRYEKICTRLKAEIERCKEIAERDGKDYSELKAERDALQAKYDALKEKA